MTIEANNGVKINSTISLKGIVKAIFQDSVHVQIGGKIITMPITDFKGLTGEESKGK
ncbi:hypothetical protein ACNRWW_16970 [Metabacillus sp. HB246100]|uniref:hypothetical protein n=1 Tax=Bacillus weihaiensis TaxID=1547283 RepID=UPI00235412C4|nr:hypothetical protein [Bacillus weihaiensis]